jgi:hypothetical protein
MKHSLRLLVAPLGLVLADGLAGQGRDRHRPEHPRSCVHGGGGPVRPRAQPRGVGGADRQGAWDGAGLGQKMLHG